MFNPKTIKEDFPIFSHQPGLVYLDSTATSLKPLAVIEKEVEYYKEYSGNVHRGIYDIAEKATQEYEETRKMVARFIGADTYEEVVFTRGTTESINLVASTLGLDIIEEGDEIVTTIMEHHSNFIPWQQLSAQTGAILKVIELKDFELAIIENDRSINLNGIITKKTKILALGYVSNTLGTINPVKDIIAAARKINPQIVVVVDAAQAAPHMKIDVQDLGCDFLAFSSHKMLGPTGVGVLWGRYQLLEKMSPYQFGGEMIREVTLESTLYKEPPHKFEAGTPNIAGVIALKAAIQYVENVGFDAIRSHEMALVTKAEKRLVEEFGDALTFYHPVSHEHRAGILTFTFKKIHPHDIAQVLNDDTVAIRAGHHCTQPLHKYLKSTATARASFYIYNTEEDIEKLVQSLHKAKKLFNR